MTYDWTTKKSPRQARGIQRERNATATAFAGHSRCRTTLVHLAGDGEKTCQTATARACAGSEEETFNPRSVMSAIRRNAE